MEALFTLLSQLGPVSDDLKAKISNKLQFAEFKRKQIVLKQEDVCDHLFFVSKGLLRAYYDKDGEDVTSWFMMDNDFIVSVLSFFERSKSHEAIEALEDCELAYIHYDDLMYLYAHSLEFNIIGRKLTEYYYCRSEERLLAMRKQKASDRYDFLLQKHPELIKRVPSAYIASYLGISRETLSRIRSSSRIIY
ncbi:MULTISPECIES: Crp/Fnr family transcriptional regulator [Chitinophaga]|uniref:Crp/Fnr family transcriptional regulator n=1 Tax=Chitinophaga TaxID=79328 RepID=UPI000DB91F0E|nr:Crp/Fnr family transcriptional regulator [Chitinophaga ginsengisegetis]MDR6570043.1 CRP-like cAMP-binding protein [Chitinophaga ginsengisegetis]MDR6649777.1 CRP-like cAMP-binding protein [Chitinophaga ginsengisegetis]MDR6656020.1 CRP-like cAMP-binding protein [Chitinophaga ginsengisegetis]